MQEAKPNRIGPPAAGAPKLRVGIVLREDCKSSLICRIRSDGYFLYTGSNSTRVDRGAEYRLEAFPGEIKLHALNRPQPPISASQISIKRKKEDDSLLSGIEVEGITAGRGFHWAKELTQSFPGSLEFHLDQGCLILVNEVDFEDYLPCVISSEMGTQCPPEFAKAQTVAARSWAYAFLKHKHKNQPFTICNDDDCQRYQGATYLSHASAAAARECCGEFLLDSSGCVCPAYYSKSCGGHRELAENAFGFDAPGLGAGLDSPRQQARADLSCTNEFAQWLARTHPAHKGILCSPEALSEADLPKYLGAVDRIDSYYRWQYEISHDDLVALLAGKTQINQISQLEDLVVLRRGASGRILSLELKYRDKDNELHSLHLGDQYDLRRALHPAFLYSSAFIWTATRTAGGGILKLAFKGAGWGHGVGLCQIGAVSMALQGYNYRDILAHYYPGCALKKVY